MIILIIAIILIIVIIVWIIIWIIVGWIIINYIRFSMSVSKKIKVGEGNIQLPWKTTLTLHKNSEAEYSFHLQSIVFIYNYPTYCSNLGLVKLNFFFWKITNLVCIKPKFALITRPEKVFIFLGLFLYHYFKWSDKRMKILKDKFVYQNIGW